MLTWHPAPVIAMHQERLREALVVLRSRPETLVVGGERPPPGVALFDHPVSVGQDEDFVDAQRELLRRGGGFPGFDGGVLVRPDADAGWTSVVFFRSDAPLDGWLDSAERRELLPELRTHLHGDFAAVTRSNGFGAVVTVGENGTRVTPEWKTAMLFRGWLQPGTTRRTSVLGALAVTLVYVVTLSLFASVKWLQFWDYID